jgi:hypothetical protein
MPSDEVAAVGVSQATGMARAFVSTLSGATPKDSMGRVSSRSSGGRTMSPTTYMLGMYSGFTGRRTVVSRPVISITRVS